MLPSDRCVFRSNVRCADLPRAQLAEKERREATEKVYDERMDMIMEVCAPPRTTVRFVSPEVGGPHRIEYELSPISVCETRSTPHCAFASLAQLHEASERISSNSRNDELIVPKTVCLKVFAAFSNSVTFRENSRNVGRYLGVSERTFVHTLSALGIAKLVGCVISTCSIVRSAIS